VLDVGPAGHTGEGGVQPGQALVRDVARQLRLIEEVRAGMTTAPVQMQRPATDIVPDEARERRDARARTDQDQRGLTARWAKARVGSDEGIDSRPGLQVMEEARAQSARQLADADLEHA